MEPDYEELDHTADWAVRVRGSTFSDLLTHAARAVHDLTGARLAPSPARWRRIDLSAPDRETLLVRWLEEILHAMESRNVGLAQVQVDVSPGWQLRGKVQETPLLSISRPIKAVTFHELHIREVARGLETTIVFDV